MNPKPWFVSNSAHGTATHGSSILFPSDRGDERELASSLNRTLGFKRARTGGARLSRYELDDLEEAQQLEQAHGLDHPNELRLVGVLGDVFESGTIQVLSVGAAVQGLYCAAAASGC